MNKQAVLEHYGVLPSTMLSSGMEADVYAYEVNKVLKIYNGTTSVQKIEILKTFYDLLDNDVIPYALPKIYSYSQEGQIVVTIEKRLQGKPLSSVLHVVNEYQLEQIMGKYLEALFALQKMTTLDGFDRFKLFDDENISQRLLGDWHSFLMRYLEHKCAGVSKCLENDVIRYEIKLEKLRSILTEPYLGKYALIHGDFFPGNLLIDETHQVTALLDFGLFTMYGDPLFDLATGWVFFDMYDELKANIRERLLMILLKELGESALGKLHLYVLLYSIFSANQYAPECDDGHYAWCVRNLNDETYWYSIG